jgi:hypothetical protein
MKKIFIYLLLIISNGTIMAQEKLFEKKINNNTLQMLEEGGVYRTVLINDKKEAVTLDESTKNPMSLANIGKNQQNWFNIINANIKDGEVFILYYNFGLVELKKYHFTEGKKHKINSYFVDKQPLISWDNGGNVSYSAQMHWLNNSLHMYINAHQQYGGKKTEGLYKFNNLNHKISILNFPNTSTKIKDENELFKTLDLDKNTEKVSTEIKKILTESKHLKSTDNFKYLDNIDITPFKDRGSRNLGGIIYFLYQDNNLTTKIIRYDCDHNLWLLGDYKEEKIKQE